MPGGRIANAIADHLTRVYRSARVDMASHTVDVVMAIQHEFFALTGKELRGNVGPLLNRLIDTGELDRETARLLGFVAKGQGQFATMLGSTITGSAVSVGIGALLSDLLQPAIGRIIAQNPALPLSVTDAVRAWATGQTHGMDMGYEVAQQGLDGTKFQVLADLSRPELDIGVLIESVNREQMAFGQAQHILRRMGYRDEDVTAILDTRTVLPSPDRLADAVTFGAIPYEDAARKARHAGMAPTDFDLLVNSNGAPPSNEELAFALRRGIIDHSTFVRGLTQGPLRNEWIPLVERMVQVPMSVADAIDTAAKGHLDEATAKRYALENGLMPEHYQPLRDAAGTPPGVQEMIALWNREVITEAELDQGIRESRLMNKYIPAVKRFAEHLPPERTVISLATKGLIPPARALQLLKHLGFADDIAHALLDEAHASKTQTAHTLTQTQILELYQDRAITAADAQTALVGLRYSRPDAAALLKIADLQRRRKFVEAAISFVHSGFRAHKIDENEALSTLDALHVPPDQRDDLMALWALERTVATKELTLAQLHAAFKAGVIDATQFAGRVKGLGYSDDDAAILTALYTPKPA